MPSKNASTCRSKFSTCKMQGLFESVSIAPLRTDISWPSTSILITRGPSIDVNSSSTIDRRLVIRHHHSARAKKSGRRLMSIGGTGRLKFKVRSSTIASVRTACSQPSRHPPFSAILRGALFVRRFPASAATPARPRSPGSLAQTSGTSF